MMLAAAQMQAQPKQWTLDECMRYAVENSPQRTQQVAQNEIYRQNHKQTVGAMLPTLGAGSNASLNFGRGVDPETNTYTSVNSFSNSYSVSASVSLFDGLYRLNTARAQKLTMQQGNSQLQYTEDLLAYETMELYYNVLYYAGMVRLAQQQLDESSETLRQARRMEELGMKAAPDVAELAATDAKNRYNLIEQQNQLHLGIIKLKEKMNLPAGDSLAVAEADTALSVAWQAEDAAEVCAAATNLSPQVMVARKNVDIQRMNLKATRGQMLPSLSLSGGYSTGFARLTDNSDFETFGDQLRHKQGYYLSASLNVPLFNGFSRSANLRVSKQNVIIAQSQYDATLREVYSAIEQAVADANGLAASFSQATVKVQSTELAYDVARRKYAEGLISVIELETASNNLLQARVDRLYAGLRYQLRSRMVAYYKGEPFLTQEPTNP
jgi:outer membrane protein